MGHDAGRDVGLRLRMDAEQGGFGILTETAMGKEDDGQRHVPDSRTNARTSATSTRWLVLTSRTGHPPATGSVTSSFHSSSTVRTPSKFPTWRLPARAW